MGHQTLLNTPKLLLITDLSGLRSEQLLQRCAAAMRGGVDAILLRAPALDRAHLLALAAHLRDSTRQWGARLLIHTHADIARAVDADGVHVARHAIAHIPAIRHWLGEDASSMTLSASCHDDNELEAARRAGADFALLSPVFPTRSHPGAATLGVTRFRQLAHKAGLPVIALGGINPDNRDRLHGFGIAVIRAILHAPDPELAARRLMPYDTD